MLERAQSRIDTDEPARKNLHFYAIFIMHNNEFHVEISIHVYNVFWPYSFPAPLSCVPFLLPPSSSHFQQEVSGCVLHPFENTELDEKAGFCFSPIKLIAFKYKIMKTLDSITDFKVETT